MEINYFSINGEVKTSVSAQYHYSGLFWTWTVDRASSSLCNYLNNRGGSANMGTWPHSSGRGLDPRPENIELFDFLVFLFWYWFCLASVGSVLGKPQPCRRESALLTCPTR